VNKTPQELHQELVKTLSEIRFLKSFLDNGETVSGSYIKDYLALATLRNRRLEILAQMPAPKNPAKKPRQSLVQQILSNQ